MNETLQAVIAAETAKLTRLVDTPDGDLGYGTDLVCDTDLREDMAEEDPNSVHGIGRAIFRRWITPRGQNADDPGYGETIVGLLNKGQTAADINEKAGLLKLEAQKDDRVDVVTVRVAPTPVGDVLRVTTNIVPKDPNLSAFEMTVALVDGRALLEAITP